MVIFVDIRKKWWRGGGWGGWGVGVGDGSEVRVGGGLVLSLYVHDLL